MLIAPAAAALPGNIGGASAVCGDSRQQGAAHLLRLLQCLHEPGILPAPGLGHSGIVTHSLAMPVHIYSGLGQLLKPQSNTSMKAYPHCMPSLLASYNTTWMPSVLEAWRLGCLAL